MDHDETQFRERPYIAALAGSNRPGSLEAETFLAVTKKSLPIAKAGLNKGITKCLREFRHYKVKGMEEEAARARDSLFGHFEVLFTFLKPSIDYFKNKSEEAVQAAIGDFTRRVLAGKVKKNYFSYLCSTMRYAVEHPQGGDKAFKFDDLPSYPDDGNGSDRRAYEELPDSQPDPLEETERNGTDFFKLAEDAREFKRAVKHAGDSMYHFWRKLALDLNNTEYGKVAGLTERGVKHHLNRAEGLLPKFLAWAKRDDLIDMIENHKSRLKRTHLDYIPDISPALPLGRLLTPAPSF